MAGLGGGAVAAPTLRVDTPAALPPARLDGNDPSTRLGTDGQTGPVAPPKRVGSANPLPPRHPAFGDLPKTSTGNVQKFVLREREWAGYDKRIH